MPNVSVYKTDGKEAGTIQLKDEVFGVEINKAVMHDAVVAHLANRRQGTQSALTRSEVRGGGIKPFRQKGTGRARQGTIRAPPNGGRRRCIRSQAEGLFHEAQQESTRACNLLRAVTESCR